jgi:hypothetical protein
MQTIIHTLLLVVMARRDYPRHAHCDGQRAGNAHARGTRTAKERVGGQRAPAYLPLQLTECHPVKPLEVGKNFGACSRCEPLCTTSARAVGHLECNAFGAQWRVVPPVSSNSPRKASHWVSRRNPPFSFALEQLVGGNQIRHFSRDCCT